MTPDHPALLSAVAASPADDLPRLVLADWLDDHGQPDRAAFIRAQVREAAGDPTDPFAVLMRHRRPAWADPARHRHALPAVDGRAVQWHPERAFRRGFGWSLVVRDVRYFCGIADRLFAGAPVGELWLPTATLDEWREFARGPWLPRVTSLHFYATDTPVDPVREVAASPLATGLEEVAFHQASRPAIPEVVDGLVRSPVGRRLAALTFRHPGWTELPLVMEALAEASPPALSRLTFEHAGPAGEALDGVLAGTAVLARLTDLALTGAELGAATVERLFGGRRTPKLARLTLADGRLTGRAAAALAEAADLPALTAVDLSGNPLGPATARDLAAFGLLARLRSLRLAAARQDDRSFAHLAGGWGHLTELDLARNPIRGTGAANPSGRLPADLTAVVVSAGPLSSPGRRRLERAFGDRLVLADES